MRQVSISLVLLTVAGCSSAPSLDRVPREFRDDVKPAAYEDRGGMSPHQVMLVGEGVENHTPLVTEMRTFGSQLANPGDSVELGVEVATRGERVTVRVALFEVVETGPDGFARALGGEPVDEKPATEVSPGRWTVSFSRTLEPRLVRPGPVVEAADWALSILAVDKDGCLERDVLAKGVVVRPKKSP